MKNGYNHDIDTTPIVLLLVTQPPLNSMLHESKHSISDYIHRLQRLNRYGRSGFVVLWMSNHVGMPSV
jgi:hypothetical protein